MSSVSKLLQAVDYPAGEVKSVGGVTVLLVDGREVRVHEFRGRLVLSFSLGVPTDEALRSLATYATGRMLREEAVLAWDPTVKELILWQAVPATASAEVLRRVFEVFMVSCDWWAERSEGLIEPMAESMIRP